MLRRNPKLKVFLLHDASIAGCSLYRDLKENPEWFHADATIHDIGIFPKHTAQFRGFYQRAEREYRAKYLLHLTEGERDWLSHSSLELAVFRPEQILKRLFKAIQSAEKIEDDTMSSNGDSTNDSSSGSSGEYDSASSRQNSQGGKNAKDSPFDWGENDTTDIDSDFDSFG
jgi:hypothetical protein